MSRPLALRAYLAATALASPAVARFLDRRLEAGKEDAARVGERFGRPGRARPEGPLVWLHGASVGESLSMLPLIAALRRGNPNLNILVTTGTVSAARRMGADLPEAVIHQFVPVDTADAVCGFLDHWRPDLAIWVESELWPRLLVETAERAVPMLLVNARVSERSARRWRLVRSTAGHLVRLFDRVLTQDAETAERVVALGADPDRVEQWGNLKVAQPPPSADPVKMVALGEVIGSRPVWLAASTHAPEEEEVAEAHAIAAARFPELLTILAPRHPERAGDIARMLRDRGLSVALRSEGTDPDPGIAVYVADTFGEMGLWFRLAPVSFVGGSIAPMGGHNPFEPAALGSAILSGPDTRNFAPAYEALRQRDAVRTVANGREMGEVAARLIAPAGKNERDGLATRAAEARKAMMPDVERLAGQILARLNR